MREVDLYDFDKTLVPFDTGTKFAAYCILHYPWIAPFMLPVGIAVMLGSAKVISWTAFKKICFSFLPLIPRERAVKRFWDKNENLVFPWFKERPREAVIVSASPDFLLNEIQKRLGFEGLICSRHNPKTGVITGRNCRISEKVRRFYEEYKGVKVCDVYSDSLEHDKPLFSLATGRCFHIVNGEKIEFDYKETFNE
ncbi:MAG: haloacid dehalogenase-like hydrolase [Eubacterium sp.]|nr:haloacid dehalogenase-like hydrolase [Eubacterium sp.]